MFNIGDTVMYGRSGACVIKSVKDENFSGEVRRYYVLSPVYEQNSTVYVPMDIASEKLKKILSEEEIRNVISLAAREDAEWIEDNKLRRENASSVIRSCDHILIIRLIKLYRAKKAEFEAMHRKFFVADDKALADAEKLLFREFSITLDIQEKDVFPLICGK